MKKIVIFTTLFLLLNPWGVALGQEFYLKSGEIISGELIGYEEGTYRVKSKYGVISILAADVASITFNAEGGMLRIVTEGTPSPGDNDLIRGSIEYFRNGEFRIKTEYGYVVVSDPTKINQIAAVGEEEKKALTTKASPEPGPLTARQADLGKIQVNIESLKLTEKRSILVLLSYQNKTEADLWITLAYAKVYATDDLGNFYELSKSTGMEWDISRWYRGRFLVSRPGVPSRASLIFTTSSDISKEKVKSFTISIEHIVTGEESGENVKYEILSANFIDVKLDE